METLPMIFKKRRTKSLGIMLILIGIGLPLVSVPLSSAYDGQDGFILRLVRIIWTGEITLREGIIKIVQDRDEQLYAELMEYRMQDKALASLPEDQIIGRFYEEKYRGLMPRVEFNLKLDKKKVIAIREKIAIPNLYIFIVGLLMIIAGEVIRIVEKRTNPKKIKKIQPSGFSE
jgi:hypothetical protein